MDDIWNRLYDLTQEWRQSGKDCTAQEVRNVSEDERVLTIHGGPDSSCVICAERDPERTCHACHVPQNRCEWLLSLVRRWDNGLRFSASPAPAAADGPRRIPVPPEAVKQLTAIKDQDEMAAADGPTPEPRCDALGLCELEPGHDGEHSTSVARAAGPQEADSAAPSPAPDGDCNGSICPGDECLIDHRAVPEQTAAPTPEPGGAL